MRVTVYSSQPYERAALKAANIEATATADDHVGDRAARARDARPQQHDLVFLEARLTAETASLARGSQAACLFVNDRADAAALHRLHAEGVRLLALRSAGFNHVDLEAADRLGLTVLRVPGYSPHAVAEHAVALLMTLNRKTHRAFARVREQNFALDGLMGFDVHGKTIGVVGTGRIGEVFARIMLGFGCRVIAFDPYPSDECRRLGVEYVEFDALCRESDVISLHCPLTPQTHHLINADAMARMKPGVMIINTSRGAVIDTAAVIAALKSGRLGGLGLDVYEEEGDLFFRDLSDQVLQDDVFVRLMTFPNVLITGHQGFFTREAVRDIAETTLANITDFERGRINPAHQVKAEVHIKDAAAAGAESVR